jgi:electron transport complex protein RnfB
VDAIIGAPKRMHAVLPSLCTGCELCVPPCRSTASCIAPPGGMDAQDDAEPRRERHARARALARASGSRPQPRAGRHRERDTAPEARAQAHARCDRRRARRARAARPACAG